MASVSFPKDAISESVLRKALYWLTENGDWELSDEEAQFVVTLHDEGLAPEFHRLINDFRLREELDLNTGRARERVVAAALKRLSQST